MLMVLDNPFFKGLNHRPRMIKWKSTPYLQVPFTSHRTLSTGTSLVSLHGSNCSSIPDVDYIYMYVYQMYNVALISYIITEHALCSTFHHRHRHHCCHHHHCRLNLSICSCWSTNVIQSRPKSTGPTH